MSAEQDTTAAEANAVFELARRVCTAKELDALALYAAEYGYRSIAEALGISRSSARDRIQNASRKIRQAMRS